MSADPLITDECVFVTGVQAIRSPRWPFSRDQFYKLVNRGLIHRHYAYEGARPVYRVDQIDSIFAKATVIKSGDQGGGQNDHENQETNENKVLNGKSGAGGAHLTLVFTNQD